MYTWSQPSVKTKREKKNDQKKRYTLPRRAAYRGGVVVSARREVRYLLSIGRVRRKSTTVECRYCIVRPIITGFVCRLSRRHKRAFTYNTKKKKRKEKIFFFSLSLPRRSNTSRIPLRKAHTVM